MGSRMIQVLKAGSNAEPFDCLKLTGTLWRVIGPQVAPYDTAYHLSDAVMLYLRRSGRACTSSAAIFEMCLSVLDHVGFGVAAGVMQRHRQWRCARRRALRVRHQGGELTLWDKNWLADLARRSWHLSWPAARTIAGKVEYDLLASGADELGREDVIDRLNGMVAAYGLADAVPARL